MNAVFPAYYALIPSHNYLKCNFPISLSVPKGAGSYTSILLSGLLLLVHKRKKPKEGEKGKNGKKE